VDATCAGNTLYAFSNNSDALMLDHYVQQGATVQFTPAVTFLPRTANIGDSIFSAGSFSVSGGQSQTGTYTANVHIDGWERVITAAGVFNDALRVTQTITESMVVNGQTLSSTITDVRWLAKDIGEVKLQETNTAMQPPLKIALDLTFSSLLKSTSKDDGDCDCGEQAGDPIHLATGNSLQREVDHSLVHAGLRFGRIYNSRATATTSFGYNWRHIYEHRIVFLGGATPLRALVQRADGKQLSFHEDTTVVVNGQSAWLPDDLDINGRLSATAAAPVNGAIIPIAWRYITPDDDIERYDINGRLVALATARGNTLDFTYATRAATVPVVRTDTVLIAIKDAFGRGITLGYDSSLRLAAVADATGTLVTYGYTATGNLEGATYADGSSRHYAYNEAAHMASGSSFPQALTSLSNENGQTYATWDFDAQGRATRSQQAGGANRVDMAYPADGTTVVTDALAQQRTVNYGHINGVTKVNAMNVPGTHAIPGGDAARGFDLNGNLAKRTDFNGYLSCYDHDLARNLQTVRVEGLAGATVCSTVLAANAALPIGARKTSVQWHPDRRLPTKIAEPGRLTTLIYNGQPDPFNGNALASCAPAGTNLPDGKAIAVLCREVKQATTDTDGHLGFSAALQGGVQNRQSSWTYDAHGQMLTAQDALGHTTTYAYYASTTSDYAIGDLQSHTNAAGQTTQFLKYDRFGRLLQSVDPNGVTTFMTYDPRQRLTSVGVGGQTTSYGYWPTGDLMRLTLPDTSTLDFTYDAARRLTSVRDTQGNRIVYTIDAIGNRIGEQALDAQGVLRRQLSRISDALGRINQVTGQE
jgi:YD repeat-containing protein